MTRAGLCDAPENHTTSAFGQVAENLDGSGRAAVGGGNGLELRRVLPATREEAYRIMHRYRGDVAQLAEDREAVNKGYDGAAEV